MSVLKTMSNRRSRGGKVQATCPFFFLFPLLKGGKFQLRIPCSQMHESRYDRCRDHETLMKIRYTGM